MAKSKTAYPDLSDLYARKRRGREESARRSLGEKIAAMEALRERLAPLKAAREGRRLRSTKPAKALRSND